MWFLKVDYVFLFVVKQGIAIYTVFIELYSRFFLGFVENYKSYTTPILFFKN